ncbi:hypothetical protein QQS21_012084 [Conoideocrella luteorostrata]|uniref:Uncharacterized protein n=1 Tax=Conoideocrella luteorostrata TaxID=1105319 RepID=A0AAJ0CE75_9HYPO|nr:hypothetical protein QQS21_012084 [Conoideocrella luteorostrata]
MSSSLKNELSTSDFEVDSRELRCHWRVRIVNAVHSIRVAMTLLALAAGIVVLGLSTDTLAVYNVTHLPVDYMLPLWPQNFDVRPTNALVAGSAIVTAMNAVSLLASKTQSVRGRPMIHSSVSIVVPVTGFIASLIAVVMFFAINTSATDETFQSWVCRWKTVPMSTRPHFGTLCKESQAALALAVLLVPLELIILATAGFQVILEKKAGTVARSRGSPTLS